MLAGSRCANWWPFLLITLSMVLLGCQVPTKQLGEFRQAFAAARETGEEVLLDYGAAEQEYEKLRADQSRANPRRESDETRLAFSASQVGAPAADAVMTRMKAWEVLGRYETTLTSLAEGRSAEEIDGTVDGLLKSMEVLSLDAAATVAPFAGTLKEGIRAVQRGIEVGKFRESVIGAAPFITDLCQWLIEDAQNFYNVRLGLRNFSYDRKTDEASGVLDRIEALLAAHQHASADGSLDATKWAETVNRELGRLPDWDQANNLEIPVEGPAPYTQAVHNQCAADVVVLRRMVDEALVIDGTLLAYRDAMSHYVLLIRQMLATHGALQHAVENPEIAIPSPVRVIETVIALRQAFAVYEASK